MGSLAAAASFERLAVDCAEQIGGQRRARGVKPATRAEQGQEALLHDVFGVGGRPRQAPGEAVERAVMLVKAAEDGGGVQSHMPALYYREEAKGIAGGVKSSVAAAAAFSAWAAASSALVAPER